MTAWTLGWALLMLLLAGPDELPGDGGEVFAGLLALEGATPAGTTLDANADIVVVLNPPKEDAGLRAAVLETLNRGGSVLLASDRRIDWGPYLPGSPRVRTTGKPVRGVADSTGVWQGQASQPLLGTVQNGLSALDLLGFTARPRLDPTHELFKGRDRIATYAPSHLAVPTGSTAFAGPFAVVTDSDGRTPPVPWAFAVGATREGGYRLLILADADVYMNHLLTTVGADGVPPDNLMLAADTAKWLTRGGELRRTHLVVNGELVTDYNRVRFAEPPPLPVPEIDPLDPRLQQALTDTANRALAQAESGGALDRGFRNLLDRPRSSRVLKALLIAAVVAGLLFVLRRLLASPAGAPPPPPTVVPPATERPAELTEAARAYLAGLFRAWGAEPAGRRPKLTGPEAGTFRPLFTKLWGLATAADRVRLTPESWDRLRGEVEAFQLAVRRGGCTVRADR